MKKKETADLNFEKAKNIVPALRKLIAGRRAANDRGASVCARHVYTAGKSAIHALLFIFRVYVSRETRSLNQLRPLRAVQANGIGAPI